MDKVAEILNEDFSRIYKNRPPDASLAAAHPQPRTLAGLGDPALDALRRNTRTSTTPGSATLPQTIRQLLFTVKRYYRPEWGDNWREHFSVDRINGLLGTN